MNMPAYERILNKEKREATIRMYGVIGRDVNGNRMAHDLVEMDNDADTIHIRINSDGGSVSEGFSVVSAILSARAYIHVHVDGIAASMAAVIAISGDKLTMQDYAKLMIHDPFFAGKGSGKLSARDIKALDSIKDSLRTVLSRRGCGKEKIASLMKEETWLSAEEAKTAGLADEIVSTPRKEELGNLSTPELMNRIMNEYQPKKRVFKMNEIAKALGLPENATEQQILDAIKARDKAVEDSRRSVVDSLLALGEKNGTVTEKNKERLKRLAASDFELFAEMASEVPESPESGEEGTLTKKPGASAEWHRLSDVINKTIESKGKKETKASKGNRTWDWYQKHDPAALARLEHEDPERFNKLLDEYESTIE